MGLPLRSLLSLQPLPPEHTGCMRWSQSISGGPRPAPSLLAGWRIQRCLLCPLCALPCHHRGPNLQAARVQGAAALGSTTSFHACPMLKMDLPCRMHPYWGLIVSVLTHEALTWSSIVTIGKSIMSNVVQPTLEQAKWWKKASGDQQHSDA